MDLLIDEGAILLKGGKSKRRNTYMGSIRFLGLVRYRSFFHNNLNK
jgi:hypothetical protein